MRLKSIELTHSVPKKKNRTYSNILLLFTAFMSWSVFVMRTKALLQRRLISLLSPIWWFALMCYVCIAGAVPTPSAAASDLPTGDNNDNNGRSNGNSSFQIIASGTQDFAALVGLFATDGVERYTIDYTRGFLPPVTAPISLLGLLGYVRALLKLGCGLEFCERTGFSTTALRSYAGVAKRDVANNEKITDVHYLERSISDRSVQWNLVKTVPHTRESMPLIAGHGSRPVRDRRTHDAPFGIAMCTLEKGKGTAALTFGWCIISLVLATSLSSFSILFCSSRLTWTSFFACAGLPLSVLIGGLPWCLVYIIEHLPLETSDWFRSDWNDSLVQGARSPGACGQSLRRRNTVAFFKKDDHFYIFNCRAVSSSNMWMIRIASCCAAVCITIAYICQYVELQYASARASGIWLAKQGILAIVRIMAWNWAPEVLSFSRDYSLRWTDHRDNNFRDSLTEIEITLCWASIPKTPFVPSWRHPNETPNVFKAPSLPKWLAESLDSMTLRRAFSLSNRLRMEESQSDDFKMFRDAAAHWNMPDYIFARWLQLRCRSFGYNVSYNALERRRAVGAWVCRIVKDRRGELHMMPGISLRFSADETKPHSEIVICFPGSELDDAQCLYQGNAVLFPEYRSIAERALEKWYPVVDELWTEMLAALNLMGLA